MDGSPGWLTWLSFGTTVAALLAAAIFGRRIPQVEGLPLVAAGAVALFLLPVAVHGYSHWTRPSSARLGLPQKLVAAVRREVPRGDVVFSDPLTAYELGGVRAGLRQRRSHHARRRHQLRRPARDPVPSPPTPLAHG